MNHIFLRNMRQPFTGSIRFCNPNCLSDATIISSLRDESDRALRQSFTKSSEHRTPKYRLRSWNRSVRISHLCIGNAAAFEYQIRLNSEEHRAPNDQISEFPSLNGTDKMRNAMRNRRINRIFRNVTFNSEIVAHLPYRELAVHAVSSFYPPFARYE